MNCLVSKLISAIFLSLFCNTVVLVLICLFWSVLFDVAWNIRAIYFVLVNADASLLYTASKVDEEVSIYYSRCTISLVQVSHS